MVNKYIYYYLLLLFIKRQTKALKMFVPKTWCTKKPFVYQVLHHGYLLTSCPGQSLTDIFKVLRQTSFGIRGA